MSWSGGNVGEHRYQCLVVGHISGLMFMGIPQIRRYLATGDQRALLNIWCNSRYTHSQTLGVGLQQSQEAKNVGVNLVQMPA